MKDAIVARVATQAADYYQDAYRLAASPMVKNMWEKVAFTRLCYAMPCCSLGYDSISPKLSIDFECYIRYFYCPTI